MSPALLRATLLLPALVLAPASRAAQAPPAAPAQAPSATSFTLPNGLRVEVRPRPSAAAVTAVLAIPTGVRDGEGLAALSPYALRLGGGGLLGYRDVDEQLESLGATFEAEAGPDFSALRLRWFPGEQRIVLGILAGHLAAPIYPDLRAAFTRAWRETRVDGPALAFSGLMGSEGAPAWRKAGSEDLKAWHRAHWTPGRARLLVAGPVDPAALRRQLEQAFEGWKAGAAAAPAPRPAAPKGGLALRRDPGTDPAILLAGVAVATEAEETAVDLAFDTLGTTGKPVAGPGWRALRATAAPGKAAEEARRLKEALARLGQRGLDPAALKAALGRWRERRLLEDLDPEQALQRQARALLHGPAPEPAAEAVNAALRRLLRPEEIQVLVVGDPRPPLAGAKELKD